MESKIRDAAISFEAIKIAMSQDKNGVVLKLSIHPDEVPQELHKAWIGSRFMVGMVQLDDQDQPTMSEEQRLARKATAVASALCRNDRFWKWLSKETDEGIEDEESARKWLRFLTGVESLSDLKTDDEARKAFYNLRERFIRER